VTIFLQRDSNLEQSSSSLLYWKQLSLQLSLSQFFFVCWLKWKDKLLFIYTVAEIRSTPPNLCFSRVTAPLSLDPFPQPGLTASHLGFLISNLCHRGTGQHGLQRAPHAGIESHAQSRDRCASGHLEGFERARHCSRWG